MFKKRKVTAIILAAGNSTRYGKNRNKNLEKVHGKTILSYSLKAFDDNNYIDNIIVAVKQEEKNHIVNIIKNTNLKKRTDTVIGGKTRKESVYNCLLKTDSEIVIIHDSARPCIKEEYINKCIECMSEFKGCAIGVKTKDTIKITDKNNLVKKTTDRSKTWIVQTPQCFDRKLLLEMHEKYKKQDVTDDCMLLEKNKYDVKMLEGDYTNIKITTYEDLSIIKNFLN